jgi:hypothetical protein
MNFSIAFLVIVTVSGFVNVVHGASANLYVLFNNGNDLYCGSSCCSATEWNFIRQTAYATRRQLRGDNDVDEANAADGVINAENFEARGLLTYPRECARLCSNYPAGKCMSLRCLGYRERLLSLQSDRMLWFQNDSCGNQRIAFQNLVNYLATSPKLGTNCKALMKAPLLMTCDAGIPC